MKTIVDMDMKNDFIFENTCGAGSSYTENGAVSYKSAGKALIDQFGKAGTARGRDYSTVWNEQAQLWAEDKATALRFPFYLRLITRKELYADGTKSELVQKGQGARDESFKRLLWIACYHPDEFYRNLPLLPIVGSWKDLWTISAMHMNDVLPVKFSLNQEAIFRVIAEGIHSESCIDLIKKYMPRIRSNAKCTTPWAKATNLLATNFCKFAGWTPKEYRQFKTTGRAHEFQRVICDGLYDRINWNLIPGKALLNLVGGNFLEKHALTSSYMEWLDKQPVVKFNGYPFELGSKLINGRPSLATVMTVNKQFDNLVKTGLADGSAMEGNVLCALDTSGSMQCPVNGAQGITSYDVCVSLGIYFAELNKGAFHNVVAMFDNTSELLVLKGDNFSDKLNQIRQARTAWGGTNFQSLIDLIVMTRKTRPNIPLEDYPKTLLVVSDMQFNPSDSYYGGYTAERERERTNYEAAMAKLRTVFPEEFVNDFKIVWWYCAGRSTSDVPSTMKDAGTYLVSGFDGSVISLILGGEAKTDEKGNRVAPSMEDVVNDALSQEVLMLVN